MGQILLKRDNQLKKSEIVIPYMENGEKETDVKVTSVYGIFTPLIQINHIVIDFDNIISFDLKNTGILPSISMIVQDKYGLIKTLDTPGVDNEVVVQIIPQFDEAYKKINLSFYISKIDINNNLIKLSGTYKLSKLNDTRFQAFGKIDTYSLFDKISIETGLGFASNIVDNSGDSRYIYCSNKSYKDVLNREVEFGGSKTQIFDWWIDFWDNINLVDIYERYNSKDKDKDMEIWISNQLKENDLDVTVKPIKTLAALTNSPTQSQSELFVKSMTIVNNSGLQVLKGTDRVYSVYDSNNRKYDDYLIEDGDVKKDVFTDIEYAGESFGDYNYLLQKQCHKAFLQKINTESIKVVLRTPSLALMRGHKVDLLWYDIDGLLEHKNTALKNHNLIDKNAGPDFVDNDDNEGKGEGSFILNKKVSGQYLITGCDIIYENNEWSYELTLNRPHSDIPNLINVNE